MRTMPSCSAALRFAGLDARPAGAGAQAARQCRAPRRDRLGRAPARRHARARSTGWRPTTLPVPSGRPAPLSYADDGGHRVGEAAGALRPRRHAALGPRRGAGDLQPAGAQRPAGADHARPAELLAAHLPGSAQGAARPLSQASLARGSVDRGSDPSHDQKHAKMMGTAPHVAVCPLLVSAVHPGHHHVGRRGAVCGRARPEPAGTPASGWPRPPDRNPDPRVVEVDLTATHGRRGDRARHARAGLDLQRRPSRAADPRQGRRSADRPLHQRARRADDRPLARRARADRDGRRARHLAARGEEGRDVHLRLRASATPASTGITRT